MGMPESSVRVSAIERQLARLVDQTTACMAMFDTRMRYLAASDEWLAFCSAERSGTMGRCHYDVFPGIPERWKAVHARGLAGETCRCQLDLVVLEDGSTRWLRWSVVPWHDESGKVAGIVMAGDDITRERQLQHSLDAAESILNSLFETVSVGLAIVDTDGRFLRSNAAYRSLVGHDHRSMQGMCIGSVIHVDDAPAALSGMQPICHGAETIHESRCRIARSDGTEIEVEQVLASIPAVGGTPMRLAVFARDVSERNALHVQLREADHFATVGRLGAGLAHDLGNLLFVFRSAIAGIERAIEDPAQVGLGQDGLSMLVDATDYIERMNDALRMLAGVSPRTGDPGDAPNSVDLRDWWRHSSFLIQRAVPRGIGVEADFEPGMRAVRIGPAAMTQLMLNLVSNAGHAIAERAQPGTPRGTVRISARAAPSGRHACLVVDDDGPGMAPDVERRVFEPYFSRRTDGAGTGMGLGLVRRAVEAAGGTITLESTVGIGTTVTVLLPLDV